MDFDSAGGAAGSDTPPPGRTLKTDIRIILVEDEPTNREVLLNFVLSRTELKMVGMAKDGEEALALMRETDFDLVFLDINLPGLSGFEIMEQLEKDPYVIFTTALHDRAVEAFEIGALDYLVKPIARDRFNKSVDRAIEYFKLPEVNTGTRKRPGLFITEKENHFLVQFSDIIYISSHENSCAVHTVGRDYVTYRTMKEMELRLPPDEFLRIYKQYIINISKVIRVQSDSSGNYTVFLRDEDETHLPIGRTYLSRVKEILN